MKAKKPWYVFLLTHNPTQEWFKKNNAPFPIHRITAYFIMVCNCSALESFMSRQINDVQGCSPNTQIICDDAKVLRKSKNRCMMARNSSSSLTNIHRWDGESRLEPLSIHDVSSRNQHPSRWGESLFETEWQQSRSSLSPTTLPIRQKNVLSDEEKKLSMKLGESTFEKISHSESEMSSKQLPDMLQTLPY
jgi:hypothetical protein